MRILHTSDWHLGRVLHNHPLLDDQHMVLDQIVSHCKENPYDALLISGDVFDRSLPGEEAIRLWSHFLKELRSACPDLPLLVIAGNHDSAVRVTYAAEALTLAKIHVRGGVEALQSPVDLFSTDGERMQIWMIPFLWAGDLDVVGEEGERTIRTQEETLAEAIDRIHANQNPEALQVALSHCFAKGGATSDSERTLIGTATEVDASLFSNFDYAALGHLHRVQKISGVAWYSGSPMPYSFSEAADEKVLLAVDLIRGKPPEVTRIPIILPHPMRRIKGALMDLLESLSYTEYENCFLEITLDQKDAGAHPFSHLKKRFRFLLSLDYERSVGYEVETAASQVAPGDLLSDYRQFALGLGLASEAIDARAALAESFTEELARKETK